MDINALLMLLADGDYHSGSELGSSLGVSRAAVWKALKRLGGINLEIESVKGKGYRLTGGLELLDRQKILNSLPETIRALIDIDLLLTVDSTNKKLLTDSTFHSRPYMICAAELQTAGRGRRGKVWVSPFGKNIYLSIAFDLSGGASALNGLSLVLGLAVIRTLRSLGDIDVMLKWPNDIWVDSKKVAGILVELQGEATTGWRVVAGIGINIGMEPSDGAGIDQPWAAVSDYIKCSRNAAIAALINNVIDIVEVFKQKGFEVFLAEWQKYDLLFGRTVSISGSGVSGISVGVDRSGILQVDTGMAVESINAGEVSVRPYET